MKKIIKSTLSILLCLSMLAGILVAPMGVNAAGVSSTTNLKLDLTTYTDQVTYVEYFKALQIYDKVVNLGVIDLSQYDAVRITYSFDGGDATKNVYDASKYHSLGLTKTAERYGGGGGEPNYSQDIGHGEMAFSSSGMTDFRTMEIDLSDVDYNGEVYLAQYRFDSGTCILISGIEFIVYSDVEVQVKDTGATEMLSINEFAYRAKINGPFSGFVFNMPTWTNTTSACTISLYKWLGNYNLTMASTPIASQYFENMKDGGYNHWLEFDAQEAGEYLFYVSNDTTAPNPAIGGTDPKNLTVGIYNYTDVTTAKGFIYNNGVEKAGTPDMKIRFNGKPPVEYFGTCTAYYGGLQTPNTIETEQVPNLFGTSVGVRLNVNAPMEEVQFVLTNGATAKEINISVYAWKGTYDATVAFEPLQSKRIAMSDWAYQGITFDEILPAGDYLFLADNESCTASDSNYFYVESGTLTEGKAFIDGKELTGNAPLVRIRFAEKKTPYFKPLDIAFRGHQSTAVSGDKFSIRFAATVDTTANYKNAGFIIEDESGRTLTTVTATVYKALNAVGSDGKLTALTAEYLGGKYIVAATLKNIPTTTAHTLKITPYVTLNNGTVVKGESKTLNIAVGGGTSYANP